MKIIINDILVDPLDKTELKYEFGQMSSSNGTKYKVKDGVYDLLPTTEETYLEHYTKDAEIFDYFAESPDKAQIHDDHRLRQMICTALPFNVGNLLDIGSGGGWVADYLTDRADSITFTDISDVNLFKLREKNRSSDKFNYVRCDALNLPFKPNSFECIIASEVIEHTLEPNRFIKELFALLKPGGTLIITTPYKEKLQFYLCVHCNKPTPRNAHLHSFSEDFFFRTAAELESLSLEYNIFGNKLLIFGRTHYVLRYLPFFAWRILDTLFSFVINKNAHILLSFTKTLRK